MDYISKIALRNIPSNAIEAIRERSETQIKASKGNAGIWIEIKDSGPGMEKEMLNRIFEP